MRKGLIYPLLSMAVAASLLAGCTGVTTKQRLYGGE